MWVNCRERRISSAPRFAASAAFTQTKTPSRTAVALDCCLTTIGNPALKHHAAAGVSVTAARLCENPTSNDAAPARRPMRQHLPMPPTVLSRTKGRKAMKALLLALMVTPLLIVPAYAKCKLAPRSPLCQPGQPNCEARCITTSDGGPGRDNMYIDGRRQPQVRRFRGAWIDRQPQAYRDAAAARGKTAWRNSGTPSPVGVISPFVPGSVQDKAWRAERAKRGIQ